LFGPHQTQAKSCLDKIAKMEEAQIEKMALPMRLDGRIAFVLGKSLVGGA